MSFLLFVLLYLLFTKGEKDIFIVIFIVTFIETGEAEEKMRNHGEEENMVKRENMIKHEAMVKQRKCLSFSTSHPILNPSQSNKTEKPWKNRETKRKTEKPRGKGEKRKRKTMVKQRKTVYLF